MHAQLRNAAFGFLVWLGFTSFPVEACRGQVMINEILADPVLDWDGDGIANFRSDEWLEIVNIGPTAVSLEGLYVSDAANDFRFGFAGTLVPGGTQVVYGSQSVAWETATGASIVGLSLNNAGDTVRLFQVSGVDTILVDQYTYAAHEGLDDRSTGRHPDGAATWFVFDSLNPYTGTTAPLGTTCPPTPGLMNGCPVPVDATTWGEVKQRYRAGRLP